MTASDSGNENEQQDRRLVLEDKAVRKELGGIPEAKRDQFLASLEMVRLAGC